MPQKCPHEKKISHLAKAERLVLPLTDYMFKCNATSGNSEQLTFFPATCEVQEVIGERPVYSTQRLTRKRSGIACGAKRARGEDS